jgi:hypothetical protein
LGRTWKKFHYFSFLRRGLLFYFSIILIIKDDFKISFKTELLFERIKNPKIGV